MFVILIGIVVFAAMLIVKPAGTLTVIYEYRPIQGPDEVELMHKGIKVCPMCAETVKAEARICRFCGHKFGNDDIETAQD